MAETSLRLPPARTMPWRSKRSSAIGLCLIAPLVLLVMLFLVLPLLRFALLSVDNTNVADALSRTAQAIRDHPAGPVPDDAAFAAFGQDLAHDPEGVAKLAARLNFFEGGMNSLVRKTAAQLGKIEPDRAGFVAFDKHWGDPKTWRAISLATHSVIPEYYLNALDMRTSDPSAAFSVEAKPEGQRIYLRLWSRTIFVALFVVSVCTLVGYPIAYYLSKARGLVFTCAMGLVLLPFWTPLLARIASWEVLLESNGVINSILVSSGLVDAASRPQLLNNLFATVLVMSYVLLPYAILPTYAVMSRVQPSLFSAALTLGASPLRAFFSVYLPQTLPGVLAGGILIFVLSFGFYLTPELVGGPSGSLIGNLIAYNFSQSLNWGLAGALSTMLLLVIGAAALLLRAMTPKPARKA
ncbi:ABC transporter permease [Mesorhizobium sp. Root695]|uniref:ABC transporter permease n=1 Tax=Mesorhizobium sp. Root695 TaxID=1736589 RepID=UPI0009EC27A3|nr:ABC transporter permease [Mesorhizobium sp. Root695]